MEAGAQQLSAPGDLSFYRTLGSGSGLAGTPTLNNKDTGGPPAATGSSSSGAYIVQVLATRDPGVARRTRDRLAARGFPVVVLEDHTGSPSVYRVRAGRYLTRQEAEAAARVLRRNRFSPWVLQEGQ